MQNVFGAEHFPKENVQQNCANVMLNILMLRKNKVRVAKMHFGKNAFDAEHFPVGKCSAVQKCI